MIFSHPIFDVIYDAVNKKFKKREGTMDTDIITAEQLKSDLEINAGDVSYNSATTYPGNTVGKAIETLVHPSATNVEYDSTNRKLTQTVAGDTSDVMHIQESYLALCDSLPNNSEKKITIDGFGGLKQGMRLTVRFNRGNVATSAYIKINDSPSTATIVLGGSSSIPSFDSNTVLSLVYIGTNLYVENGGMFKPLY